MAARPFSISAVGVNGPLLLAAGDTPRNMGICVQQKVQYFSKPMLHAYHCTTLNQMEQF